MLWGSEFASQLELARKKPQNNRQTPNPSRFDYQILSDRGGKVQKGSESTTELLLGRQENKKTEVNWVSSLKVS